MATDTLYPASDGYIASTGTTFSGAHDAASGTSVGTGDPIVLGKRVASNSYEFRRAFTVFNLGSIIPSTITALSLTMKCSYATGNTLGSGNGGFPSSFCWVTATTFAPTNPAAVAVGDFSKFGAYPNNAEGDLAPATDGTYTVTYTGAALAALKSAAASNGGYICLGFIETNHDSGTYGFLYTTNGHTNQATFYGVETSGTGNDPVLTVTYTPAVTYTDSPSGALPIAGSSTDEYAVGPTYTDAPSGTLTLAGSSTDVFEVGPYYEDTASGTLAFSGSATDEWTYGWEDAPTGTLGLTGVLTGNDLPIPDMYPGESWETSSTLAGSVTLTGTATDVWNASGISYADTSTGTLAFTGTISDIYLPGTLYTDTPTGTLDLGGGPAEILPAEYADFPIGALVLTGDNPDRYYPPVTYTDTAVGTIPLTGFGTKGRLPSRYFTIFRRPRADVQKRSPRGREL